MSDYMGWANQATRDVAEHINSLYEGDATEVEEQIQVTKDNYGWTIEEVRATVVGLTGDRITPYGQSLEDPSIDWNSIKDHIEALLKGEAG